MVALGVSWVWLGLKGKGSKYPKLPGSDPYQMIRDLQSHGIRVLGPSIIGLEEHTPENISQVIADAIGHGSDWKETGPTSPPHFTRPTGPMNPATPHLLTA